jgi:hypothetical protein
MSDEDRHATRDEVAAQAELTLRLRQEIARLAGEIADTEERVASTRRQLAASDPARTAEHIAAAERAERFAAYEREQAHRWRES